MGPLAKTLLLISIFIISLSLKAMEGESSSFVDTSRVETQSSAVREEAAYKQYQEATRAEKEAQKEYQAATEAQKQEALDKLQKAQQETLTSNIEMSKLNRDKIERKIAHLESNNPTDPQQLSRAKAAKDALETKIAANQKTLDQLNKQLNPSSEASVPVDNNASKDVIVQALTERFAQSANWEARSTVFDETLEQAKETTNYAEQLTKLQQLESATTAYEEGNADFSAKIRLLNERIEEIQTFLEGFHSEPISTTDLMTRLHLESKIPLDRENALMKYTLELIADGNATMEQLQEIIDTANAYGEENVLYAQDATNQLEVMKAEKHHALENPSLPAQVITALAEGAQMGQDATVAFLNVAIPEIAQGVREGAEIIENTAQYVVDKGNALKDLKKSVEKTAAVAAQVQVLVNENGTAVHLVEQVAPSLAGTGQGLLSGVNNFLSGQLLPLLRAGEPYIDMAIGGAKNVRDSATAVKDTVDQYVAPLAEEKMKQEMAALHDPLRRQNFLEEVRARVEEQRVALGQKEEPTTLITKFKKIAADLISSIKSTLIAKKEEIGPRLVKAQSDFDESRQKYIDILRKYDTSLPRKKPTAEQVTAAFKVVNDKAALDPALKKSLAQYQDSFTKATQNLLSTMQEYAVATQMAKSNVEVVVNSFDKLVVDKDSPALDMIDGIFNNRAQQREMARALQEQVEAAQKELGSSGTPAVLTALDTAMTNQMKLFLEGKIITNLQQSQAWVEGVTKQIDAVQKSLKMQIDANPAPARTQNKPNLGGI